ncbi:MAG TPA: glycosyltransferase [Puia sp.]|nr:glycosyltransferase [Puia sp.]
MAKRVVISVISDLVTDQRVHKVSLTLHEAGYQVFLIGARRKNSMQLLPRPYPAGRLRMIFQRKAFFYIEFNLRLFVRLLYSRTDMFLGNDLDVMPAVWLAGFLRRKPVIYDTHEYFLGMPELDGRPFVKKCWQRIETFIFPRLRHIYTICDSFAELYYKDYGKSLAVVRNVPLLNAGAPVPLPEEIDRRIPKNKFLLLFQGAGINPQRGVEELVAAMSYLDPARFHLIIVGGGDIFHVIEQLVRDGGLSERITMIPKVPFEVLRSLTPRANLGLSLDKPNNTNHIYGLPNKIFDYLHAGVPVLVSRLVELEKIVVTYDIGDFIDNHSPEHIAARIEAISRDPARLAAWKQHTERARQELNWETEGRVVVGIFEQIASNIS